MEHKRIYFLFLITGFIAFLEVNAQPDWEVRANDFEYNMTLTGVVSINDTLVENTPGVIVGAFNSSSKCLGKAVARYYESIKKYRVPMMIYNNQSGEEIHLKVYIPGQDKEFEISNTIQFQIDGSFGNFVAPLVLKDKGKTTVSEFMNSSDDLLIFPVPVKSQLNIHFQNSANVYQLMLFDIAGRLILEKNCFQEYEIIDLTNYREGTYLLHIISEMGLITRKVIKQ